MKFYSDNGDIIIRIDLPVRAESLMKVYDNIIEKGYMVKIFDRNGKILAQIEKRD